MIDLTICICTIPRRYPMLARLLRELHAQIQEIGAQDKVEILTNDFNWTTGAKRKFMYEKALGKYVCSVDDDDTVYNYYIKYILEAIESDPDAVGMNGIMTVDGRNEVKWFIAKDNPYDAVKRFSGEIVYVRFHNHLSPIRTTIARQIPFPDQFKYEDYDFAKRLNDSGLIKTEVCIGTQAKDWLVNRNLIVPLFPMYHYRFLNKKID